jgi:hypothetical protein
MTSLPLGLPDGSVRSILALARTGCTIYLWVTGMVVPPELLAVNSLVVGNYFGSRTTQANPSPEPEVVDAPYIPGPDGNG